MKVPEPAASMETAKVLLLNKTNKGVWHDSISLFIVTLPCLPKGMAIPFLPTIVARQRQSSNNRTIFLLLNNSNANTSHNVYFPIRSVYKKLLQNLTHS